MPVHPPIHHNPDKMARITFWNGPEFKSLKLKLKDRKAALSYVKSYYPRAKSISVVFYVQYKGNTNESP